MTDETINPEKFFAFEKKNNLFEKKHKDFFFWDIIRFDVYYDILWNLKSNTTVTNERGASKTAVLAELFSFIMSFVFKRYDFIFFTTSRNKNEQGTFFDQNLEDIIKLYPNGVCYESYERDAEKLQHKKATIFNPINFFRIIFGFLYRKNDYSEIVNLIKQEYKTSNISSDYINTLITQFQIDYEFYGFIFRIKRPKAIFITQNGIQKGLFAAASKFNIPVIEVQHGIIDEGHLSYNYSREIDYSNGKISLPAYFFTFSNFWAKDLYYPVKDIVVMGNSCFYNTINKITDKDNAKGLLVASSDVFGDNLKELVVEFSKHSQIPVYFKLHPNQFREKKYYTEQFKDYCNVQVFTNDKSIYELLEVSDAILVIQSTAIYEALHLKRIGVILKKQTYTRHEHLFGLSNVYLVDNAKDLSSAMENNYKEEVGKNLSFFDDFDEVRFFAFMNMLQNQNLS